MLRREKRRDMADVNIYTAGRLNAMARSLGMLAKSCTDHMNQEQGLTKEDAVAAMEMSAAMVCGSCSKCSLHRNSDHEDGYYLYYLLRAFEQKNHVEYQDMPRLFLEVCKRKEEYLEQLNRNLGRATMNLEWKNRFLESRDTVMIQFRELATILEEFAYQMEQAADITQEKEEAIRRAFRQRHVIIENMLILEYANKYREAYLTAYTTGGKCITTRDGAELFGQVMGGRGWYAPADTRTLITRKSATVRFSECGEYRMVYGIAKMTKTGEGISGDNYTYSTDVPGHVMMSISDGMGSGDVAARESERVVELLQQLLETGFSPRAALKMVNTILLLTGTDHPATLDLACVDLRTGVLEAMKLGAVPTFVLGQDNVEILEAGEVPAGINLQVEPILLSRKLWDGDRIIMMTDGVLDACQGDYKELTMKEYIEGMPVKSPQDMAERIMRFACQSRQSVGDDMTVLVAGVWKRT